MEEGGSPHIGLGGTQTLKRGGRGVKGYGIRPPKRGGIRDPTPSRILFWEQARAGFWGARARFWEGTRENRQKVDKNHKQSCSLKQFNHDALQLHANVVFSHCSKQPSRDLIQNFPHPQSTHFLFTKIFASTIQVKWSA